MMILYDLINSRLHILAFDRYPHCIKHGAWIHLQKVNMEDEPPNEKQENPEMLSVGERLQQKTRNLMYFSDRD